MQAFYRYSYQTEEILFILVSWKLFFSFSLIMNEYWILSNVFSVFIEMIAFLILFLLY